MSFPIPPFGDDPKAGAGLPIPNIGGDADFAPKLNGLEGDAALEAPKANAPVEVVGDAAPDPPKEKGEDPGVAPNEKVVGDDTDPVLVGVGAPKPEKTGDCEG